MRREARRRQLEHVKQRRIAFSAFVAVTVIATVPFVTWNDNVLVAWGAGVLGAGALWMLATAIIATTGTVGLLMGADAEDWTVAEIRKLGRGWSVIEDVPTDRNRIDHVAVDRPA